MQFPQGLMDRSGNVTEHKIPTLKEVLEWGKGKVAFNFDNKYMNTKGLPVDRETLNTLR